MTLEVSVSIARVKLSEVIGRAEHGGQRTVLQRHGKPVAAVVPMADIKKLERSQAERTKEE